TRRSNLLKSHGVTWAGRSGVSAHMCASVRTKTAATGKTCRARRSHFPRATSDADGPVQLVSERANADAEQLCGLRPVVTGPLERTLDQHALRLRKVERIELDHAVAVGCTRARIGRRLLLERQVEAAQHGVVLEAEEVLVEHRARGEDDGALDRMR